MRKFVRNALVATAATATVVGMTSTPALAATWTIANGGNIQGTNVGNLGAVTDRGTVVTCTSGTAAGALDVGSSPDDQVGSLTSLQLSGNDTVPSDPRCVSTPGGIFVAITVNASGTNPFPFFADTYDSGADTVTGRITNVTASFTGSDGCSGVIGAPGGGAGTVPGQYDNSAGQLTSDPSNFSLEVQSLSGTCDPELVQQGDGISLAGVFDVRNGANIPTITSP